MQGRKYREINTKIVFTMYFLIILPFLWNFFVSKPMANASQNTTASFPFLTIPTSSAPSFSNPPLNPVFNQLITVKLDKNNYLLWKTIALPILKGYKHLTNETPCSLGILTSGQESSTTMTKDRDATNPGASSSSSIAVAVNPAFEQWVTTYLLLLDWLYNRYPTHWI